MAWMVFIPCPGLDTVYFVLKEDTMEELYAKIAADFAKQGLMQTLGARLDKVVPGEAHISCAYHDGLGQQHGYFHAGVITSLVDSACGYAAHSLMPEGKDVLSVEFKVNLLKPANTPTLTAIGKVVQSGRTLTVCEGNVYDASGERLIARMTATMIAVDKR